MALVQCSRVLVLGLAVVALAVGCRTWIPVETEETVRDYNREQLNRLSLGMTKDEVLETMGSESVQTYTKPTLPSRKGSKKVSDEIRALYRGKRISNPYRTEASRTVDGVFVEILFYYTDQHAFEAAITDDELTPLVIEGGALAGWGGVISNRMWTSIGLRCGATIGKTICVFRRPAKSRFC